MKIYKVILLILIVILLNLLMVRIHIIESNTTIEVIEPEYRFLPIQKWINNMIVYDTKTGVEYFVMNGSMTLLVDADGKPLLYENRGDENE